MSDEKNDGFTAEEFEPDPNSILERGGRETTRHR